MLAKKLAPHLLFRMLHAGGVCSDNLQLQLSNTTNGENPRETGKSLTVCALCKYILLRLFAKEDMNQKFSLYRSKMYYHVQDLIFA